MLDSFQQEYKKHEWKRWKYKASNIDSLKPHIPPAYGVYIIRAPHPLNRVHGSSDVIYIGQSGGGKRRGIQGIGRGSGRRGRLFNRRSERWVRERIEELYGEEEFVVECYFTQQAEDPLVIEEKLLSAYKLTYFELPPANHQSV